MLARVCCAFVTAAVLLASPAARADVRLPALLSDGMVLQQKASVRIWGWASDGEKVKVTFRDQAVSTQAKGGKWSITLKPLNAGGPWSMTIQGDNAITLHDVLVGEVWVCSGQSNMEFGLSAAYGGKAELAALPDPELRMFTVGHQIADLPQTDAPAGIWESSTPANRGHFSAVGYYFGRALRKARHVPVGLLHTSWGGTPAEAWTSRRTLEAWGMPQSSFRSAPPVSQKALDAYQRSLEAWKAAGRPQGNFDDPGVSDVAKTWSSPRADVRDWSTMALPQPWEQLGPEMQIDGGVWFRKEIDVPARWAGKDLELGLGAIDDFDTTYLDGNYVGATGIETSHYWESPRRYPIPASLVHGGRAVLAVRVWDHGGWGGFTGPADAMWIAPLGASATERISLASDWRFKVEIARPSMPSGPSGADPNAPSVLYNGMIAPLLPYTIKGVTWYQGESNAGRAAQYRSLLSTMIRNWRTDWGIGNFPFLIVQLAPFMDKKTEPEESDWAALREAQRQVSRELPNVGLAVITDVGDEKDIHPTKKEPVGERLALAARRLAYKENIVASGPTFRSATTEGRKVIVRFDNIGKGLGMRGEKLTGFTLAEADKTFFSAEAFIDDDKVVVWSRAISRPKYLRFGWANYPLVNLWNDEGLPAGPFQAELP
jgi:sialate O-acetylesterase